MGRTLSGALVLLGLVAQTAAHLSIVCTATSGQQPNTFAFWFITYHNIDINQAAPGQVHITDPTGRTLSAPFSTKCKPTGDIKQGTGQTAADYEHSLKTYCLGLTDAKGNSPVFADSVVACYNKDTLTPIDHYALGVTGNTLVDGYYGSNQYDHYFVILDDQFTKTGSYVTHFTDVDINLDACGADLPCALATNPWTFEISVITSPPKCTTAPPAGLVANTVPASLSECDGSVKDIESGILCHAQCADGYAKVGVLECIDQMDGTAAWNPNFQCNGAARCLLPSDANNNNADIRDISGVMPPCSTVTPAGTTCQYTCPGSNAPMPGKVRCQGTGNGLEAVWKKDENFEVCPPDYWGIGCYEDAFGPSFTRQLPTLGYQGTENSISRCASECYGRGFAYAGVEYAIQCWCGNSMAGARRMISTDCEVRDCPGNTADKCGDGYRMKVIQFTAPTPAYTPVLEGCYEDDTDHTKLPNLIFSETKLTNAECATACQTRGFKYSGTQAGKDCYCGDDLSTSTRINTEACNMDCSGDSSSKCGGVYRNTVYSLEALPPTPPTSHEGCFKDDDASNHKLPHLAYVSTVNTLSECVKTCRHNGFMYAGAQFGTQCWCGNDLSTSTRTIFEECDAPCPGGSGERCGKAFRNWVVSVQATAPKYTPVLEGCFDDEGSDDKLPTLAYLSSANDVEECTLTCQHNGFTYAGLQHGTQCWCGNDLSTSKRTTISECDETCPGDAGETCGAAFRNQVYALKAVAAKGVVTYEGCFRDYPTRELSTRAYSDTKGNTISECTKTCYHNGFRYAGLQYASQCWCGQQNTGKKTSNNDCNMKCSGDSSNTCGAGWKNQIYDVNSPPSP